MSSIQLFVFFVTLCSFSLFSSTSKPLKCIKKEAHSGSGWYRDDGHLVSLANCNGEDDSVCLYGKSEKEGWYDSQNVLIELTRCSSGLSLPVGSVCSADEDCDSSYCARVQGQCSNEGNCTTKPSACTKDLRPVCGCDGQNYSNPCVAASHGVSVDYAGYCLAAGACLTNADCDNTTEYCSKSEGTCAIQGICVPTPHICTFQYEPVCGCDGKNYSNPCIAWSHGTAVDYHGPCTSVGRCSSDADCGSADQYCMKAEGVCDALSSTGMCSAKTQICTMIYDPVCGCDGQTYANDCVASSSGQNVKARGECL